MVLNTLKFNNIHNFILIKMFNGLRNNYAYKLGLISILKICKKFRYSKPSK